MFVGMCSASTALGSHEAIFMSHPTTILNTCQQRKYYLKREKSLWCASACRDFCKLWKLWVLVRDGVRLHTPPHPLGLPCASEDHPSLQNSSGLSAAKWSFSLTHSFAGRCVYIKGGQTQRWNVTRMKDKVDSIFLNLGDVSDLQLGSNFDFFFFNAAVERINKTRGSERCRSRKGSEGWTSGWSFCQIFIECWGKNILLS